MSPFLVRLGAIVGRYRAEVASPRETLALLRWQMAEGHALDDRATLPGHVTTSAIVVSPDHRRVLLIDHIALGRWLQPGGHYEAAPFFHDSAAREAVEETGVAGLRLHPWHQGMDLPFVIDSHDVSGTPGAASRTMSITIFNISSWPIPMRRYGLRPRRCTPPSGRRSRISATPRRRPPPVSSPSAEPRWFQAAERRQPAARRPAPIISEPPVQLTARCTPGLRMDWRAIEARSA